MFTNTCRHTCLRQRGLTLVELVMFIVIISVGIVGLMRVMNVSSKYSADPMIRKQALAIAESLLEEIQLQPFTYCLPSDDKAQTATGTADCTGGASGSEDVLPTAARVSNTAARDAQNVADYSNFKMTDGIRSLDSGEKIGGLENYSASVTITQVGDKYTLGLTKEDVLQIDVTITPPSGETITLTGYRFRYAPRAVP